MEAVTGRWAPPEAGLGTPSLGGASGASQGLDLASQGLIQVRPLKQSSALVDNRFIVNLR